MAIPFKKANILLPKTDNMELWSVVACDQYTSEPDYWNSVKEIVKDTESTLNLILPEIYLEESDVDKRINNINKSMESLLTKDFFQEYTDSMFYIERTQNDGLVREGLIGMVDLEDYSYELGSTSMIRATEKTVIERIPPRVKVRQNALLELPHIMILIDDANEVITKLEKLADKEYFNQRYNLTDKEVLLFAMGDGNHSLATAKACYEELKKKMPQEEYLNNPARYALVEIVNLHSSALEFEAIHRVIFNTDVKKLMSELEKYYEISYEETTGQKVDYITKDESGTFWITNPKSNIPVGSLQIFLDEYLKNNPGKIDYIHGEDVVRKFAQEENNIGFILPTMKKEELFKTVILDGALPRKTFSMGHSFDKRYYLEARKIK